MAPALEETKHQTQSGQSLHRRRRVSDWPEGHRLVWPTSSSPRLLFVGWIKRSGFYALE